MFQLAQGELFAERYKIIGCLGSGHHGQVFLARDINDKGRQIALKIFHHGLVRNSRIRAQLSDRVRLASTLRCPALIAPIDFIDYNNQQAIVLEYVPGQDILSYVKDRISTVQELMVLWVSVATALEKLHSLELALNDLTPAHILVTQSGEVKFLGLPSKIGERGASYLESNVRIGTAHYHPPEFLRSGLSDPKNDLYSWGVIAQEILEDPVLSDAMLETGLLHRLSRVITRATELKEARRYKHSSELTADLTTILNRVVTHRASGTAFVLSCTTMTWLVLTVIYLVVA